MRSPFFKKHLELNAKMIDFNGWEMPILYSGIIDEHKNVRENVGLFDVSHMGRFRIKGENAERQIQHLITNDISKINDQQAIYSPICNESGGIIDDVIISKINVNEFLIIVNSSNIKKDFEWIKQNAKSCKIEDITDDFALLALQGPKAVTVLKGAGIIQIDDLKPFHLLKTQLWNIDCIISRTGYTGEDGFEIFFDSEHDEVWDKLLDTGSESGIKPVGLGARDTLRLEAGLMLYGNDIDEDITPLEAPLKWTVKFETDFIGKKALQENKIKRKLRGFEITDSKRVARKGNEVFDDNEKIGKVTSGSFSPTLNKPIGFCFVPIEFDLGKKIKIDISGKFYDGNLTSTRFYKR
ncbi:MAG: glycine cleavage system aminomethyltransferase GcvT [Nitrosopumilaceae archaeon]